MTLRRQILIGIYTITLLIIFAMSGIYYYVFTRDVRERSQQSVQMVFNIIADDFKTRIRNVESKVGRFTQESLMNSMDMITMFQDSSQIASLMGYLASIIDDMHDFAPLIEATEIRIYDEQRNLLAFSQHEGEDTLSWVYLSHIRGGIFVEMPPGDHWYTSLQNIADIPAQPLPENLPAVYDQEFPETMRVALTTLNGRVAIRFAVPIIQEEGIAGSSGKIAGLCIVYMAIDQHDVERYAKLGQTQVNVFAGTDFSVGTLPEYQSLPAFLTETVQTFDIANFSEFPPIEFLNMEVEQQSYYQGALVIGGDDRIVCAITAHFPRQLEEQQKRTLLITIAMVALGFCLLAAAIGFRFSSSIVHPISRMVSVMKRVESGHFDIEEYLTIKETPQASGAKQTHEISIMLTMLMQMTATIRQV